MTRPKNIAIDGPAAAGKNALGIRLADYLNFQFVDTGVMFRSVAWYLLHNGLGTQDLSVAVEAAKSVMGILETKVQRQDLVIEVIVGNKNITNDLWDQSVEYAASIISQYDGLRTVLLLKQRSLAASTNTIMVGRDTGTVVLPGADIKLFLTASQETRAKRRFLELKRLGRDVTYEMVFSKMRERDERDQKRKIAPLLAANDAIIIDTENLTTEDVFKSALSIVKSLV